MYRNPLFFLLAFFLSGLTIASASSLLGLPKLEIPAENEARIELGKKLFFEKRLSADGSLSCSSCHLPEKAFTDGLTRSIGITRRAATRNAPSLFNLAYAPNFFWDGRSSSLESQIRSPLLNPAEHGFINANEVARAAMRLPYREEFRTVFNISPDQVTLDQIAIAIASYLRQLLSADSAFDRHFYGKENNAMSADAIRGLELFQGKAKCSSCHLIGTHDALLTDDLFHASITGLPETTSKALPQAVERVMAIRASGSQALDQAIANDLDVAALGRFNYTLDPKDIGQFRTPSLRNVALTAPYMHDGSLATLESVLEAELYLRDSVVRQPIVLSSQEKRDLLAFLNALTSSNLLVTQ